MTLLALVLAALSPGPGSPAALVEPGEENLGGELSRTGERYEVARVRPGETVDLLDDPDGEVVERLDATTEFGSPRTFYVAERSDGWLGVTTPELPNGQLGWLADDPLRLQSYETSYSVHADLSEGEVSLSWGEETIVEFPVTVGRPGSETPPGTFSVTDGLAGAGIGPYYGCCVLALSGHQPNLPPGWIGGDRIAIHGTPGEIGGAASAGCLRASDPDMVSLFALAPLGTPVFIEE